MSGLSDLLGVGAIGQPFGLTALGRAQQAQNQAYQNALTQNAFNQLEPQRLANASALANSLAAHQPSNVTPIRPERTPEQIREQLEARMAEMEAEAERLRIHALTACSACRWCKGAWCNQPLVIGIKQELVLNMDRYPSGHSNICGPEKALWEPAPTFWQRFTEWLSRMIERAEGRAINKGDR